MDCGRERHADALTPTREIASPKRLMQTSVNATRAAVAAGPTATPALFGVLPLGDPCLARRREPPAAAQQRADRTRPPGLTPARS